jgi:putative ABC transport system permease protein
LRANLAGARYASAESQVRFYNDAIERVSRLSMVRVAAVSTDMPLRTERPFAESSFQIAGRALVPAAEQPHTGYSVVSRDFFRTLGVPLRSGRTFNFEDTPQARDAIVVNEAFAEQNFPDGDAVGHGVISQQNAAPMRIVGVVGGIRGGELGVGPTPLIYHCTCQGGSPFLTQMSFLVRTTGDPESAIHAVEAQIYSVDREEPLTDIKSMDQRVEESLSPQRFHLLLIGIFAVIAILLAAVGVYGVMSYLVNLRTREIGIRVAVGAGGSEVLQLILGESFALTAIGGAAGLIAAAVLTRYLKSMLYGVTTLDGWTFAAMPFLLAAIAIISSLIPALRASRIDPMRALRED